MEFVTLKDGSEGLIIYKKLNDESSCKFIDPFLPSDTTIDVTKIIDDPKNNIITKSNRKLSFIGNNVCIADGLNEDLFHRLNKANYHSNIYTSPIFKTIQKMLSDSKINENDIISKIDEKDIIDETDKIELANGENFHFKTNVIELVNGDLFHFRLKSSVSKDSFIITGIKKSPQDNEWKETRNCDSHHYTDIFSYQQLINQDLALITKQGIFIYTIDSDLLSLRYFWNNEDWNNNWNKCKQNRSKDGDDNDDINNDYKTLIQEVLKKEFSKSFSLPSPNFLAIFENCDINDDDPYKKLLLLAKGADNSINLYKRLLLSIIYNPVEFLKFGSEILKIAIEKENDYIVQLIINRIIKLIDEEEKDDENNSINHMMLLPFIISLKLPELCDNDYRYSHLVTKYFLHTSMILDPACLSVKNLENPSLYAYSKIVHIKKSNNNYFNKLVQSFYKNPLKIQQKVPKISFYCFISPN